MRLAALLTLVLFAAAPRVVAAESVRIAVGSYNLNNLPFPLAVSLGAFQRQGLDVSVENFASGGSKVLQALMTHSIDVAVGFVDHAIQMQAQGRDVVAFVLLSQNSGLVMMARPGLRYDKAQLAGKKFGVTSPGSSSDFFVRHLLKTNGYDVRGADVIGVGSGGQAVVALQRGGIDFLVNYDPAASMVEAKKAGEIVFDARTAAGAHAVYGGNYPTSCLYTTRQFLEEHREVVQRIANAEVEALRWIAAHTPEQIYDASPREYVGPDRAVYVAAIGHARGIFSPTGEFRERDMLTPLRVLREFDPKLAAAQFDLSRAYTNEFVLKANAEGGR